MVSPLKIAQFVFLWISSEIRRYDWHTNPLRLEEHWCTSSCSLWQVGRCTLFSVAIWQNPLFVERCLLRSAMVKCGLDYSKPWIRGWPSIHYHRDWYAQYVWIPIVGWMAKANIPCFDHGTYGVHFCGATLDMMGFLIQCQLSTTRHVVNHCQLTF